MFRQNFGKVHRFSKSFRQKISEETFYRVAPKSKPQPSVHVFFRFNSTQLNLLTNGSPRAE